jgi:hypothetical protein
MNLPRLSHAAKAAITGALIVVLVVAALAGAYLLIGRANDRENSNFQKAVAQDKAQYEKALRQSQVQWCDTLNLLTSVKESPPADPAKNPSRVGQYQLYEDFVHLKTHFGCKS